MKKLINQLLEHDRVGLVDVGGSGGPEPRWQLLQSKLRHYVFEPDPRSFEQLAAKASDAYRVYCAALGSRDGPVTFNLCRQPQVSSIYPPNRTLVDEFPDKLRWDIVSQQSLPMQRLDGVLDGEMAAIDFLKVDTQGSELDVLVGADRVLKAAFGAEIEVEFVEIYQGQPLFGAVCNHLQQRGFMFFDFTNLCRWQRGGPAHSQFGQCVFGDAVFLKHPKQLADELGALGSEQASSKARRYAAVLALYDRPDLLTMSRTVLGSYLRANDTTLDMLERRLRTRRSWLDMTLKFAWHILARGGFRPFPLQVR